MDYEQDRTEQPSLVEMTRSAIRYLQQRSQKSAGYLLVVEGARIDHGHHKGSAHRALTETIMMSDAVAMADEMTKDEDTLIIVTADHSHTLSMAGYPGRGNPILGLTKDQQGQPIIAADKMPYTTLGYTDGKGMGIADEDRKIGRQDVSKIDTEDADFHQEALFHKDWESHGGDDVALHAKGAGAAGFSGLMEQHEIYHVMRSLLEQRLVTGGEH